MRAAALAALALSAGLSSPAFAQQVTIPGIVTDGAAPLEGALVCGVDRDGDVRVAMATSACAITDASGAFAVETTLVDDAGELTAAAVGHRTTDRIVASADAAGVTLIVPPLGDDGPAARWWPPLPEGDADGCGTCHVTIAEEWSSGVHARGASNDLVRQLYEGTDAQGGQGVAPGYLLDHDDAGPCGACHAATATWSLGAPVDLRAVPAEHAYGVSCVSCHAVREATPGAGTGADGALAYYRPTGDAPFAFGPYPNVLTGTMASSYAPTFRRPELCAGCHELVNDHGVAVMDTYSDWLAVGDPEFTTPCQGCHMRDVFGISPRAPLEFVVDPAHDHGGEGAMPEYAQRRDPAEIARHETWGGVEYAPYALDLMMSADLEGDQIVVTTSVMNIGANHRVPTGMPFREILLVVTAEDEQGSALALVEGPQIGARGGGLAGAPGRLYAKSLADDAGNLTFAFWDAHELLEDTRLATGEADDSELRFAAPAAGDVHVTARLLYRRFSHMLADAKRWDVGEQELAVKDDDVHVEGTSGDAGAADSGAETPDAGPGPDFREGCVCRSAGAPTAGGDLAGIGLGLGLGLGLIWRRGRR